MMDLEFEDQGTLVLIRSKSDAGEDWLESNVAGEQYWSGAWIAEPRFAETIANGAINDGLEVSLV